MKSGPLSNENRRQSIVRLLNLTDDQVIMQLNDTQVQIDSVGGSSSVLEILMHPTTVSLIERYNITNLGEIERRLPEFYNRIDSSDTVANAAFDESLSRQAVMTAFNSLTKVSKKSAASGKAGIPVPPEISGIIAGFLGNEETPPQILCVKLLQNQQSYLCNENVILN